MPLASVLVIEDDPAIRRGLMDALRLAGYDPRQAADGPSGLSAALAPDIDLVLLDLLLPGLDGISLLEELRRIRPALPVIVLTARGQEEERVRGLRAGADDYMVKPFGVRELLARIEAVLRRSPERPAPIASLELAGCHVDFERRQVRFADGSSTALSPREAEVLAYLAARRGRVVSREELLLRVWGVDPRGVSTRTVDMTVARLRDLLRDNPARPRLIATVRARGYLFLESPPADTPPEDES